MYIFRLNLHFCAKLGQSDAINGRLITVLYKD